MIERTDGNWIQTFNGKQFWPLNPRPEDIDFRDIAHALAMKCRYTGHCLRFYSIAQHSVLASQIVPPADAKWALLHDAAEAYLADVARPVKRAMKDFQEIEDHLLRCIIEHFGLSWPQPDSIHQADLVLLRTERRDLMAPPPIPWRTDELAKPLSATIFPDSPGEAEVRFLKRFKELFGEAMS